MTTNNNLIEGKPRLGAPIARVEKKKRFKSKSSTLVTLQPQNEQRAFLSKTDNSPFLHAKSKPHK